MFVCVCACVPQGGAGGGAKQGEGAEAEFAERSAARAGQQCRTTYTAATAARPSDGQYLSLTHTLTTHCAVSLTQV